MATLLLIFCYIIFIGLGIPDSLLGASWPMAHLDIGARLDFANFITILLSLFTMISSFFSARIVNKFGMGVVVFISTFLTAVGLIGFSVSNSIWWFCLFSIPSGLGAGGIDATLNNFIAVRYKASFMSFSHCFYGVGVALSPYIMSFALKSGSWRLGYRATFFVQIFITIISIIAIPLWKKVKPLDSQEEEIEPITLSYKQMYKTPAVKSAWLTFFSTCGLEFTCGIWACTFLVYQGMSADVAAKFLTLYYIGMTSGRILSGIVATKLSPEKIVAVGYCIVGMGLIAMLLPLPITLKGFALLLVGLGNGPSFPNLTYITPKLFGKEKSQSLIGSWLVVANAGILLLPALFGLLANSISPSLLPIYLFVLFALMCVSTVNYIATAKKHRTIVNK